MIKEYEFIAILFAILAFVSGIAFLIKYIIIFHNYNLFDSLPTLILGIGSIIVGFGFISIRNEVKKENTLN